MHRCQTNMDRRPACWWWMMIVRPADQHPSPLLIVDISAEPLDSLSGRHVQVTKHPEGPAPPYQRADHQITIMDHYLKNCHPTQDSEGRVQDIIWASFDNCMEQFFYSFSMEQTQSVLIIVVEREFLMVTNIIWAVLDNRHHFKAVLP